MAQQRTHTPLNVLINGRIVGALRRESIAFKYSEEWLDWEHALLGQLVLSMH